MKLKAVPKSGHGNSQIFKGVGDIIISKCDGITYAVLIFNNRRPPTYIPADEYRLIDSNMNIIEICGH